MDWPNQCAAVIPCLNEAASISNVVRGVRGYLCTVIVVDDGSVDGTAEAAIQAGATVLRHEKNLGKGAALATGWRAAREQGFTWAICLDGDSQHDPRDIPAFLVRAAQTRADLVVGNRFHNGAADMPLIRQAVNRWMSRRLSALGGQPLPDSQCGYRLLRLALWERLHLATWHFEIESELLLAALAAGACVDFVPVKAYRTAGRSKIRPALDTWRWIRWWRTRAKTRRVSRSADIAPA